MTVKVRILGRLHHYEGDPDYSIGVGICWDDDEPDDDETIGLIVQEGGEPVCAILTTETALLIANRLQRAVNLVLESIEDAPDFSREFKKLTEDPNSG